MNKIKAGQIDQQNTAMYTQNEEDNNNYGLTKWLSHHALSYPVRIILLGIGTNNKREKRKNTRRKKKRRKHKMTQSLSNTYISAVRSTKTSSA